jgi:hypothetical protein
MTGQKKIAILSKNVQELFVEIDSSLKNMYYFFNFENESHPVCLIIVDGEYGLSIFNNYKIMGLISPSVSIVYVENIDISQIKKNMKIFDHSGIVVCYKNIFKNYQNISSQIQNRICR